MATALQRRIRSVSASHSWRFLAQQRRWNPCSMSSCIFADSTRKSCRISLRWLRGLNADSLQSRVAGRVARSDQRDGRGEPTYDHALPFVRACHIVHTQCLSSQTGMSVPPGILWDLDSYRNWLGHHRERRGSQRGGHSPRSLRTLWLNSFEMSFRAAMTSSGGWLWSICRGW